MEMGFVIIIIINASTVSGIVLIGRELFYRMEVTFCDKLVPGDPGFSLDLSARTTYDQMARAVARHLSTDPFLLQFLKSQGYVSIAAVKVGLRIAAVKVGLSRAAVKVGLCVAAVKVGRAFGRLGGIMMKNYLVEIV